MHSLQILHTAPPSYARTYEDLKDLPMSTNPIHIDASRPFNDKERLEILHYAMTAAEHVPVFLYTNIPISDCYAPCGCEGYDYCCSYHRYRELEVAECFCYNICDVVCEYHKD
jgi:hypothetical protein